MSSKMTTRKIVKQMAVVHRQVLLLRLPRWMCRFSFCHPDESRDPGQLQNHFILLTAKVRKTAESK